MYEKPSSYTTLVRAINNAPDTYCYGAVFVNVELTLTLLENLGLLDEPITVGWVVLSGTPMPNEKLNQLSPDQRRMVANARQIVPLDSRFAWEEALRQYARIPPAQRNYDIEAKLLDKQILDGCKANPERRPAYIEKYNQILSATLRFKAHAPNKPVAKEQYTFFATDAGRGTVRFTDPHIAVQDQLTAAHWFTGVCPRDPISINFRDLAETARFLDERERALGNANPRWVENLAKIHYQRVEGEGADARLVDTDTLHIDGFFHMAGIVSSGKTTLAILIAAYAIRCELDIRITFVVGDTNTAVQLAHRFNSWFCSDPAEEEQPVAVPILGQSTKSVHLKRLLASREYSAVQKQQGRIHWGERWLSPVCLLNTLVEWDRDDVSVIPLGHEPCQSLRNSTTSTTKGGKARDTKYHICPLFAICPAKQMYRDMPNATLWVTTPGALAQSSIPHQLENRSIKLGDLVYEQSDLVIFDEAETIVDWFDRTYANNFDLTNGKDGLLDRLDSEVTTYIRTARSVPPDFQRWRFAVRAANGAATSILSTLNPAQGQALEYIRTWVANGRFTRNALSYRLSRRLAGLKEYEFRDDLSTEQLRADEEKTLAVLRYFEELDRIDNPLERQTVTASTMKEIQGAQALAEIMQQMNSAGQDVDTASLIKQCRAWITRFFPDFETKLGKLKAQLEKSTHKPDKAYLEKGLLDRNVEDIALRLFFTLWVVVLDWHLSTVFNEWHRKPLEIAVEQPYRKIPLGLRNILPVPAAGGQYGLYRAPIASATGNEKPNLLTQFVYVNIGRWYVLNFHRLRTDLDGLRGPNVFAMSGTSYLPDSSRFNLQVHPNGVLAPDDRTRAGLKNSHFEFKPFYNEKQRPIAISGKSNKKTALQQMVQAMINDDAQPGGFLGRVLMTLSDNAATDPENWEGRARLVLFTNSYDQAKVVARAIQKRWPEMATHTFYLTQGKDEDFEAAIDLSDTNVQRVDIEQFAETGGTILVAPMQSIGRGFNILNKRAPMPLAAFGAVLFLMRPMSQPEDYVSMAQEINRYTMQWASYENVPEALTSADGVYNSALALRDTARKLWRNIETRRGYASLTYSQIDGSTTDIDAELNISPRSDLAATTAGLIIQAVGRLLRGGVPFYAYFTDAAWAPETAKHGASTTEMAETSLLQAMIDVLLEYAQESDAVGNALYSDLADKLCDTTGLNGN